MNQYIQGAQTYRNLLFFSSLLLILQLIYIFFRLKYTSEKLSDSLQRVEYQTTQIEVLALLPEESPEPVILLSNTGKILYSNPAGIILLDMWEARVGDRADDDGFCNGITAGDINDISNEIFCL